MSVCLPVHVSMSATTLLVHFSVVASLATIWPEMDETATVSFMLHIVLCILYFYTYSCGVPQLYVYIIVYHMYSYIINVLYNNIHSYV